jgi:DNA polymerase-4
MQTFADFSPDVEPLSLDEAFLEMTGAEGIFGAPETMGRKLKAAIREATGGLTVSVGLSATKYVAKVASGYAKPDGLTIVAPAEARAWLAPQSVAVLWGAGPKMQTRLAGMGIDTIGDLAAFGEARLEAALGRGGRHFFELSQARDPRRVESDRQAKGMSSERTLTADVSDAAAMRLHVRQAATVVARRLRESGQAARGVRLKLKTHDFRILTRQRRLREAANASELINETAQSLLGEIDDPGPFRLIGVAVFDIEAGRAGGQLELLGSIAKGDRLDAVLDELQRKFGPDSVRRAADLVGRTVFTDEVNLESLRDDESG